MIHLGFDTSNYTTSVACCGSTSLNIRKLLEVKLGERGLRQSDAVFQHMKGLPDLFSQLCEKTDITKTKAIGVSTKPRNTKDSYMPVFLAGLGYAKVCAKSLGVPLFEFSHQDGHIMAGIDSCKAFKLLEKPFISVHLSGGTCEILRSEYKNGHFESEIIGGTKDISAGQLIDRVGVAMGMKFPSGREMELTAKTTDKTIKLPVNTDKGFMNFSGIETKTLSLIGETDNSVLALSLFTAIAKALTMTVKSSCIEYGIRDVLIVGGVASNSIIKKYLIDNSEADIYFASPEYSTDNAYGISLLAKLQNNCKN